jgi:uncharacterized protein (DUF302 family)
MFRSKEESTPMGHHYGFGVRVSAPMDETIDRTTAALKEEGFGVLTTIDVKATLKAKIDVDFKPYVILGACNPKLAYRSLQAEEELGLLLPCNVIVYDNGDGTSSVSVVDPGQMMSVVENDALTAVAAEAKARLERVVASLQA